MQAKDIKIDAEKTNNGEDIKMNSHTLNRILFGPPGTGKTYNTINESAWPIAMRWTLQLRKKNAFWVQYFKIREL